MIRVNDEIENAALQQIAQKMCVAARTAPKGRGKDLLVTAIIDGEEKAELVAQMRLIAARDELAFFARDAGNVELSPCIVFFASRKEPLGLPHCGFCGFEDCGSMQAAGALCSFNSGDLGIAVGSAVSVATDHRVDNRIMYSAGKAALELGLLGDGVAIAFGVPLSATGKNPFFDRG